jgi:hypothetical protein
MTSTVLWVVTLYFSSVLTLGVHGSVVGVATGFGLDGPGI